MTISLWNRHPRHRKVFFAIPGADLGVGSGGAYPPPPPRWPAVFQCNWYSAKKKTMWFIGVEVEQETSAPLPTKNTGSAPAFWGPISARNAREFPAPSVSHQWLLTFSLFFADPFYIFCQYLILKWPIFWLLLFLHSAQGLLDDRTLWDNCLY